MKPVKPFADCRGSLISFGPGRYDLAIDPGTVTGWALFNTSEPGRTLAACGTGEPPDVDFGMLVIELPQVYPNHPVPPNDLVQLAFLAGRYVGMYHAADEPPQTVAPHEWKGNLPKEVYAARVQAKLSPAELAVLAECEADVPKSAMHNVLDAIGIGLFAFRKVKL